MPAYRSAMTVADEQNRGRGRGARRQATTHRVVGRLVAALRGTVQWLGFWTAVSLPLAYFYLFLHGLTATELVWLTQLFGLHLGALTVGRGYKAESAARDVSTSSKRNQSV